MTLIWAAAAAAALMLTFALTAIVPARAAAATTVTVTTTVDETNAGDGTCSLREAVLYANRPSQSEPDCATAPASGTTTIVLPAAGPYTLRGEALTLNANATITGAGATTTTINAAGHSQVLVVQAGANLAISDVAITGGVSGQTGTNPVNGVAGGGIANDGTLALNRVIVTDNRTSPGATTTNCMSSPGCSGGQGGDGGGISNSLGGTLTIASSVITANSTGGGSAGTKGPSGGSGGIGGSGGSGGGISSSIGSTITITNSTIAGNATGGGANGGDDNGGPNGGTGGDGGSGAGIETSGPLVMSGSTISGNETGSGGGGGAGSGTGTQGGENGAGGGGGAIASRADMTISNSTIVDNSAGPAGKPGPGGIGGTTPSPVGGGNGGGIDQLAMGTTLTHVTIASNRAAGIGGGINGDGGTLSPGNSIIASNQAAEGPNCDGVITNQGGNVESGASSCPGFLRADPRLSPLASNGGPTQTVALQPGSAAIHHVGTCVVGRDQRGVGRPVGTACDSGAYQVAPPSVGGISAGGVTTISATIGAAVNPNLQGTTVVVNYGTTQSYGSSTPPQALGAGNAPAPFAAALAGLQPGTTYHFDVVARNADGTTTSTDGVFTTLPPLTASITRTTTTGPVLTLTIACGGGFGPGTCAGNVRLTSRIAAKRAHTTRVKRKPRPRTKVLTVATGAYSVPSGGQVTVKMRLNRKGRAMLTQHYVLASTLSLTGTTAVTQGVTFRYPRIEPKVTAISYTFSLASDGTGTPTQLTIVKIPRGGKAMVICRGGGCPYPQRTFVPRHGQVVLAPTFQHRKLRLGATITLEVTAANRVGEVKTFKIGGGPHLIVSTACLPPGVNHPTRCL